MFGVEGLKIVPKLRSIVLTTLVLPNLNLKSLTSSEYADQTAK